MEERERAEAKKKADCEAAEEKAAAVEKAAAEMAARKEAAERATECCMLLIELEQCDAVLDALLKASLNRIPKLALAATNAVLMAVTSFGTPKVVPASAILKGLAPLFDAALRDRLSTEHWVKAVRERQGELRGGGAPSVRAEL